MRNWFFDADSADLQEKHSEIDLFFSKTSGGTFYKLITYFTLMQHFAITYDELRHPFFKYFVKKAIATLPKIRYNNK